MLPSLLCQSATCKEGKVDTRRTGYISHRHLRDSQRHHREATIKKKEDVSFSPSFRTTRRVRRKWTCQSTHRPNHLNRICPRNIAIQTLPTSYPAGIRVVEGDQAFVDLRCAFLDGVVVTAEAKNVVAVGATFAHEFLFACKRPDQLS